MLAGPAPRLSFDRRPTPDLDRRGTSGPDGRAHEPRSEPDASRGQRHRRRGRGRGAGRVCGGLCSALAGPAGASWTDRIRVPVKTSGTDKRQQHHGRFAGDQGVGRTSSHLQPRPRTQLELLAVNGEAQPSGQDLNHGGTGGLMLGQPLARVEAEHGDVHPIGPMHDLGDNGTGLDSHVAGGIGDQRMRHTGIIVRPTATVKRPARRSPGTRGGDPYATWSTPGAERETSISPGDYNRRRPTDRGGTSGPDGRGHPGAKRAGRELHQSRRAAGRRGGGAGAFGFAEPGEGQAWRPGRIASCDDHDHAKEAA